MNEKEKLVRKAMDALVSGDNLSFAACFSPRSWFYDYCPALDGGDCWVCHDVAGIEMFMANKMTPGSLSVSGVKMEEDGRASFFVSYGGPYHYAMFEIREVGSDGRIRRAVVYPA